MGNGMSRIVVCVILASLLAACQHPKPVDKPIDFGQPLPTGIDALRKLPADQVPDFSAVVTTGDLPTLQISLQHSLDYLKTRGSMVAPQIQDFTHERSVATLVLLQKLLDTEIHSPANDGGTRFNDAIKANFDVYQSVGAIDPNNGTYTGHVLFTGYYTPTYDASPVRTDEFKYPLYKRPTDLWTDPTGEEAHRVLPDGTIAPAYTREQIEEQHVLDGDEFVWLADRFAAYIITVQGSARLKMPDGKILEVGYAGNNGYPYSPIGRQMVADGVIKPDQLSLDGLRMYFAAHPEAMDHYLPLNPRTVFFANRPGGPYGSLNQPVTPFATVATDKTIFPRALPVFITAPLPLANGMTDYRGIMFDQDTGGAIRAAGRADIYMGLGEQAGQELNVGEMYYLAIKTAPTATAP